MVTHFPIHRGHLTFECSCGHQADSDNERAAVVDHCYIAAGIDRLNDHANKETTP